MKILIAEDDFTSRMVLTGILQKFGHEVVTTENGAEAWLAMQQPDAARLAILDWMMPEMDGVEVCRRIRTLETDQPPYIIILTSKGEHTDIVAGLDAGADDYLSKPFNPGVLRARVNVGRRMLEMQDKLLEARNALVHQAMHDPLTGIFNRRAISEALAQEISRERRQHNGLALGICDIDYFKKVNDTYGHLVGDEVLCGVVSLLKKSLREYDTLGRFGGEEFVVIAPCVKENNVDLVYERLRSTVADTPIPTQAGNIAITISIGVESWRVNETENDLLASADLALYQAKTEGRNRVCHAGVRTVP